MFTKTEIFMKAWSLIPIFKPQIESSSSEWILSPTLKFIYDLNHLFKDYNIYARF